MARTARSRTLDESCAGGIRASRTSLGCDTIRLGRLRQGRGHCRRCGYRRVVGEDHGEQESAGALLHWRSCGRNRTARRVQFSVGMGLGILRWPGDLTLEVLSSSPAAPGGGSALFFHACHHGRSQGSAFSSLRNRICRSSFGVENLTIPQCLCVSVVKTICLINYCYSLWGDPTDSK